MKWLAGVTLLLCTSVASANDEWHLVSAGSETISFFRQDGLTTSQMRDAWLAKYRRIPKPSGEKSAMAKSRYDCSAPRMALLHSTRYLSSGESIGSHDYSDELVWDQIVPESNGEEYREKICSDEYSPSVSSPGIASKIYFRALASGLTPLQATEIVMLPAVAIHSVIDNRFPVPKRAIAHKIARDRADLLGDETESDTTEMR